MFFANYAFRLLFGLILLSAMFGLLVHILEFSTLSISIPYHSGWLRQRKCVRARAQSRDWEKEQKKAEKIAWFYTIFGWIVFYISQQIVDIVGRESLHLMLLLIMQDIFHLFFKYTLKSHHLDKHGKPFMNPKKMRFIIVFLVLVCLQCGQREEERERERERNTFVHIMTA